MAAPTTFSITGGTDAALFQIAADGHTLEFISPKDFESDPHSYDVQVTASDGLNTTPQDITVTLTDVNDVAPTFTSSATPSVAENSTTVVSLAATDPDTVGGPTTFSITGGTDAALFQIAADGHTLEFISPKDFESDPHSYDVQVTASDGLNTTPQDITVTLTDVNDVAPTFTSSATPSVAENSTTVVSLAATDPDTVGGPTTFSITGGTDAALFQIAADGHTLEFISPKDFESDPHSYDVQVTASDGLNTTPQDITVTLTDVNDVAPTFTSSATPSVAENSTTVVSLAATDPDTVGGPTTFSITGGTDAALFQIAADGHTLEFISPKDFESDPHSYDVQVTASDGLNTTPQDITVTLTDVNDVAPTFTSSATPSVAENSTTVVSLAATDPDTVGGPTTFSITGGTDAALFQIAADGHTLEFISPKDFESDPHSYDVQVTASDGLNTTPQDITVTLTDVNDVAPTFTSSATPSVAENSTTVVSLAATDPDTVGGPTTFSITGGTDAALFQIAADGHTLEFISPKDFESDPHSYDVQVTASDGLNTTPQDITVTLTDVNDVAPTFTSSATPSVAENSTTVVSLAATDPDTVGGPTTFSITGGTDAALFQIAADGHTLEFISPKDFESDPHSYDVQVTASDGLNTTPQDITVTLTDVNDVAPTFTSSATPSVAENSTTVVSLAATDPDTVGGPTTFSITGGTDAALFQIAADGHTLEFISPKDFESDPHSYDVQVTASDGLNTTPQDITVTLTDVNDVAPTFTSSATPSVAENSTTVVSLAATDPDTVGGPTTFSITGGTDAALFQIAADGHTLEFISPKDFESDPHSYDVQVTASDGLNTTPQDITVTLTDVNDVAPTFTSSATPSVAENSTTVVSLAATDPDTVGGPTTFSITGGTDAALFQIAADGHTLEFISPKDFESDPHSYDVQVTASDGLNTTPQDITVTLTDVNDVAPTFTSSATPSVAENSTTVVSLAATDPDTVGGPTTFSITGGTDAALFQIAADGHTLEFISPKDFESDPHSYDVQVTASDGLNTTPQDITVTLTDVNDVAPTFTSSATPSVAENSTTVVSLAATDPDTVGGPTTFSITGGTDAALFQIAADGHTLEFISPKDFESDPHSYDVQVTASDGLNTTPQDITVTLTDVNDVAPVVTTLAAQSVNENAAFSVALTSTDADTVGTNPATFTITGGADQGLFSIDGTGHLTMTAKDFENPADADHNNTYVVEVTANDGVNSTPKTITVTVTDVNEAPTQTAAISMVTDNVGTIQGPLTSGGVTDDTSLALAGTISAALAAGEVVAVYDGATRLGTASVVGTNWTYTDSTLANGNAVSYTVRVEDAVGNQGTASSPAFTTTIDTAAPTLTVTGISPDSGSSSTDGITSATSVTVSGTIDNADVALTVTVFRDGVAVGTATVTQTGPNKGDWTLSGVALSTDGAHTLTAQATDAAGNTGTSSTFTATRDTSASPPTGLDLAAADDSGSSSTDNLTNQTSALTISGSGENGATVILYDDANNNGIKDAGEATLGTATIASGTFSTDIALGAGVHHIRAIQTDLAGNTSGSSASLDITVDITAPSAPTSLNYNNSSNKISGSAEANSTINVYVDLDNSNSLTAGDTLVGTGPANGSGSFSNISVTAYSGSHKLLATATDAAGNVSGAGITAAPQLAPAGVAGSPINLGLGDPTGSHGEVTLTVTGAPSDWTLNGATYNSDGIVDGGDQRCRFVDRHVARQLHRRAGPQCLRDLDQRRRQHRKCNRRRQRRSLCGGLADLRAVRRRLPDRLERARPVGVLAADRA